MKNTLILLFLIIFASGAWAQTPEPSPINYGNRITNGTVLLGGGFNFYSSSTDSHEENGSSVGVNLIGALSQHFGLGVGIGYSSTKSKFGIDTQYEQENKQNLFTISPAFAAFGNVHFGWLQPMAILSVPIGFGSENDDTHTTQFGGELSAGLNIYLSKRLALNGYLGILSYTNTKVKDADDSSDDFQVGFSPSNFNLGLIFVLGGE